MATYSIGDLEKLSGIKAHTLRVWEQRYGIIAPQRSGGNVRYYEDQDLKLVMNIALLNKNGYKISKIAKMNRSELLECVHSISEYDHQGEIHLDALTLSMIEMDEYKFDKLVSAHIQQYGFHQTMIQVINPFLAKLSLLYMTGSVKPAQENFMNALIRQKIIAAIDKIEINASQSATKILLFMPEGESQELTMLYVHFLLKSKHFRVIYLGGSTKKDELELAYSLHKPAFMFTVLAEISMKDPSNRYVFSLANLFPKCTLMFAGYVPNSTSNPLPNNVRVLPSLEDLLQFTEEIKLNL